LIPLREKNLHSLPDGIKVPDYDRSQLTPGMVHIGLGNFHRAHQSWYLHRLFDQGLCHDWAIIGAGVRPPDAIQRERLKAQDCLTTLIELDPSGKSAEIIGSMIDYISIEEKNASLIARMAEPDIRIVSLTVTEGGYYVDPSRGGIDTGHSDIIHDVSNPHNPKTAFGAMIEALRIRRAKDHGPFTGLSCDNLQGNGSILRRAIVELARLNDKDLANWIEENCSFPNSMVDCIVPATGECELELVKSFGIDDQSPVTHENFRQWVIEDNFCAGRPDWDKVGATFTDDVHSFEAMKIRILNGGHQLIADAGEILSINLVADCMSHPLISAFFRKVAKMEIAPHVNAVPGMSADDYVDLVDRRFSNPEINDTVRRVAFDGSSRQTGFILPTLREALDKGAAMEGLALSQAIWARMCQGTREDCTAIEPNDPIWQKLNSAAIAAKGDPQIWLNQRELYGDLADNQRFQDSFQNWSELIASQGLKVALKFYLK